MALGFCLFGLFLPIICKCGELVQPVAGPRLSLDGCFSCFPALPTSNYSCGEGEDVCQKVFDASNGLTLRSNCPHCFQRCCVPRHHKQFLPPCLGQDQKMGRSCAALEFQERSMWPSKTDSRRGGGKTQDWKLFSDKVIQSVYTSANLLAIPVAPHPRHILGRLQLETLDSRNGFVAGSNGCIFVALCKTAWNDVGTDYRLCSNSKMLS